MKLILLNETTARLFGLAAQDQDEAAALAELAAQGFNERAAKEHLREAILSGAFRPAENVIVSHQFRNDAGRFVPAALQDADGEPETIMRAKRGGKS